MDRRSFLKGSAAALVTIAAPAIATPKVYGFSPCGDPALLKALADFDALYAKRVSILQHWHALAESFELKGPDYLTPE